MSAELDPVRELKRQNFADADKALLAAPGKMVTIMNGFVEVDVVELP